MWYKEQADAPQRFVIRIFPSSEFFFLWPNSPTRVRATSFLRLLNHTIRHTTVSRTLLDGGLARRRDLYLTYNTTGIHNPLVEFEPAIPAIDRPQALALKRSATGIDLLDVIQINFGLQIFKFVFQMTVQTFSFPPLHLSTEAFAQFCQRNNQQYRSFETDSAFICPYSQ